MSGGYKYELWDGFGVVGYYISLNPIRGESLALLELNPPQTKHGRKTKGLIKVPLIERVIFSDGIDTTYRLCLDVRKKSKRQRRVIVEQAAI